METMEATAYEQMILKLGLVTEGQMAEIHEEIGDPQDLWQLITALERKGLMTPWQRGKVLKGDIDGYILGGYKLLYKIQSGSFGRVYRAVDPRDGTVTAVKVLRRRWSEDQARIDMFIREGKVGLLLKHPNIVEVLAINRDPSSGQYYIVMEFVEGGNLREILQIQPGNKMSAAQSLRIAEDCAAGLTYAYGRGMTHRDIKLTNILISDTGEAKLVDFGLAQFFSTLARKEEEKVDRTVDYAGLERATNVKTGDVRSDIYFVGCVLYECLTGRPPMVMTRDKHARMRKGRFEEVRSIHPNEIDGPPSVLMLVETMMALDPKERYQTPSQLVDAIRTVRREAEGRSGNGDDQPITRAVFLAEPDEHLQDVLREKLKNQGYRVFLAGDPMRALDRYRQQPYDGLIVDARTTGDDGFRVFEHIVDEADRRHLRLAGLLLLDEEQADWAARLPSGPHVGVIVQDITFKTVSSKLKELMTAAHDSNDLPTLVPAVKPPPPPPPPPPAPPKIEIPPDLELPPRTIEAPPRPAPASPKRRDPMASPKSPAFSPPRKKEAAPPPRRESKRSRPAASFSMPLEEDIDIDAPLMMPDMNVSMPHIDDDDDDLMSPLEDDDLMPSTQEDSPLEPPEAPAPPPRAAAAPPPRQEEPAPPPRQAPKAASPPTAPAPPRQTPAPLIRRPDRPRRTIEPASRHVPHEEPIQALDTHHWREEMGLEESDEKKADTWTRIQKYWAKFTPKQKSIAGFAVLGLVVLIFFYFMVSNMLVQSKFDKIQIDMTEEEVDSIMGGPGEEIKLVRDPKLIERITKNAPSMKAKRWVIGSKTFMVWFTKGYVSDKQLQEQ